MTETLAKTDPAAALDYIGTLNSDRFQKRAVQSLTRVLAIEYGSDAEIWLSRLSDPKLVEASQKTLEDLKKDELLEIE